MKWEKDESVDWRPHSKHVIYSPAMPFLLCIPNWVFAWGELGHRAIGEAVQESLD